jgi:hypothetical protein
MGEGAGKVVEAAGGVAQALKSQLKPCPVRRCAVFAAS